MNVNKYKIMELQTYFSLFTIHYSLLFYYLCRR